MRAAAALLLFVLFLAPFVPLVPFVLLAAPVLAGPDDVTWAPREGSGWSGFAAGSWVKVKRTNLPAGRAPMVSIWTTKLARADKATPNLYWQRADGTGEAERLTESRNPQSPASWHPSGRFLAFHESDSQTRSDIMLLPMEGDETSGWKPGKPIALLNTRFAEQHPAFSPDGRWLAYSSDESGRHELYVRPFPGPGGRWQVSANGGSRPNWSRQRRELIFRVSGPRLQMLMVAAYAIEGASFRAEKPRQWTPTLVPAVGPASRPFDLHPDGERIALVKGAEQAEDKRVHVVLALNFFDELRRLAPAGRAR